MAVIGNVINLDLLKIYLLNELNLKDEVQKLISGAFKSVSKFIDEKEIELNIIPNVVKFLNKIREKIFETKNKLEIISDKSTRIEATTIELNDVSDCYKYLRYLMKICKKFNIKFDELYNKLQQSGLFEFIKNKIMGLMENVIPQEKLEYIKKICNKIKEKGLSKLNVFVDLLPQIQLFNNLKTIGDDTTNIDEIEIKYDEKYKLIEDSNSGILNQIKHLKRNNNILLFTVIFMLLLLFGSIVCDGILSVIIIFYVINSY